MRAVRIEESAAIRSPFFNDFLRRDWALRNRLGSDRVHDRFAAGIHDRFTVGADALHLLRLNQLHGVVRL